MLCSKASATASLHSLPELIQKCGRAVSVLPPRNPMRIWSFASWPPQKLRDLALPHALRSSRLAFSTAPRSPVSCKLRATAHQAQLCSGPRTHQGRAEICRVWGWKHLSLSAASYISAAKCSFPPDDDTHGNETPALKGGQHLLQPVGADFPAWTWIQFGHAVTYIEDQQAQSIRAGDSAQGRWMGPLNPRTNPERSKISKNLEFLL